MKKHFKKILAVVLVLAIAISTFAISTTAQSTVSRVVSNVNTVVDLMKIQNDGYDAIKSVVGDKEDLSAKDVSDILGGADLDDVIGSLKDLSNAGLDSESISNAITDLVAGGEKVSPSDFVEVITSAAGNAGAIDEDTLKDVVASIAGSEVNDSDALGSIAETIADSLNLVGSTDFGSTVETIVAGIKNLVDTSAKDSSNGVATAPADVATNKDGWVGTWSTSMVKAAVTLLNNDVSVVAQKLTARNRVTSSIAGDTIRLTLSNQYGTTPLAIGEVTVAIGNKSMARAVDLNTMVKVTVGGKTSFSIPAGQTVQTDPIKLSVKALDDIVVSMYFPSISKFTTVGLIGGHCYASVGNNTEAYVTPASIDLALEDLSVGAYEILPVLSNIDVYTTDKNACSAVFFGDSTLTNTIPVLLAKKLQANGITNIGVLQQAIKGNEILRDGQGIAGNILGKSGLSRFYADAISQPGVKYIFIKIGANDILHPHCQSKVDLYPEGVDVDAIINGYKTMINAAHKAGKTVILVERSAFKGYTRNLLGKDDIEYTQELEDEFNTINKWVRSADCPADYTLNIDALRNPADPAALVPAYTIDGAHFTPAGCQAFVDLIPLEIFGGKSSSAVDGSSIDKTIDNAADATQNVIDKVTDGITDGVIGNIVNGIGGIDFGDGAIKLPNGSGILGGIDIDKLVGAIKGDKGCIDIGDNCLDAIISIGTGNICLPNGSIIGKLDVDTLAKILAAAGAAVGTTGTIAAIVDLVSGRVIVPDLVPDTAILLGILMVPGTIKQKISWIVDYMHWKTDFGGGIITDGIGELFGGLDAGDLLKLLIKSNVKIDKSAIHAVIDLAKGTIKTAGLAGKILGKVDIEALKLILKGLGKDIDLKADCLDIIIDLIKGVIKLPDGTIIGHLPDIGIILDGIGAIGDIDWDNILGFLTGGIKLPGCDIDCGKIDLGLLVDILKGVLGGTITLPGCGIGDIDLGNIGCVIDMITGVITLPDGSIIGKIDVDLIKGILDKLGCDCTLPKIDVIIDLIHGVITLPGCGGIIGELPNIDGGHGCPIIDKIKDIFDWINGGTKPDTIPGTTDPKDPTDKTPSEIDPSVKPVIDEVLEDVGIIEDTIISDDTPLGDMTPTAPADPSDKDNFEIANTSDAGIAAVASLSVLSAAAFVVARKKHTED